MLPRAERPSGARPPVERWFLRRGIPHFIEGYAARTDILTRIVPLLTLIFFAEVVLLSFGDRYKGFAQAVAVIGTLCMALAAVALLNRLRHRRWFQLPDRVGPVELVIFVVVPPLVALALGSDPTREAIGLVAGNAAFLGLSYVVASYGLVPMTRWAFGQVRTQLRDSATLMVKTLPLLVLFSAFFFLSTEAWQLADNFALPLFFLVLAGLVALGSVFIGLSIRTGVNELSQFATWHDVCAQLDRTPLEGARADEFPSNPCAPPLGSRARLNLALVMFVSQAIQVLLVAVAAFVGLVIFGLLTVREKTIVTWLGDGELTDSDRLADLGVFGHDIVLTRQQLIVAAFVAAFAGLQFAVSVVTDATYRAEFAEDMAKEVRQALAVREIYLVRPGA